MSIHDEIMKYQQLWDDAQDKMPVNSIPDDGVIPELKEKSAVEILNDRRESAMQDLEWRDMLLLAEDIDRVFNPNRFDEQNKTALGDIATQAASSSNPVHKTTIGKDQELYATPEFSDGEALRQLSDLKVKVEALEKQLHSAELTGTAKQENNLQKEMASVRSKLEELSQKLTPHIYTNPN